METFDTTDVHIKDTTITKSWYLVDYVTLSHSVLHQFVFERPVYKEEAWQLIDSEFNLDGRLYPIYVDWLVYHENASKCHNWSRLHIWSKSDILRYERTVANSDLLRKTF